MESEFIQLKQQRVIAKSKADKEARDLKVLTLIDQVFAKLSRPLDKYKLTPVYDAMNLVGVDPDLKEDVKNAVISRINQEVGA